ncbi:MAG TPA: DUF4394 domain-containing protein [Gammaproteobacteria bacterium]|nr:DUF4394 domain-containing protein [Gammaproteobacteria bacterium]
MRTRSSQVSLLVGLLIATALAGCDDIFSNDDNRNGNGVPPPGAGVTSGDVFAVTSANRLVTFNRAAPALSTAVAITGLAMGETILGIDIRPGGMPAGQLYLLGSTGRLYTVDTTTGMATLKSTLSADPTDTTNPFTSLSGTNFGVDFNPTVDRLRVTSDTGQDLRINVDTGAVITDGTLNVGGTTRNGITEVAYTNSFAATCRTALFYLDTTANTLFTTSDPNNGTLSAVGSFGVMGTATGGFEIATASDGSNTALAVFNTGSGPTLYTINLTTGAATSLGAITGLNSNEQIRGIAAAPPATSPTNAVGSIVAVTESGKIISFQPTTPQKLCTSVAATGMQAGETIYGIDTRPADGMIYAVGSTGRLYTLNASTGVLTSKSTLAPAMGDPFTGLMGTSFGVDFNPAADRLRITSDAGQDLRINVDTGAVTTDGALNPAGLTETAVAYTNSFVGTGTTTLFGIDPTTDSLVVQGLQGPNPSPNNGDLTPVGTGLGVGDVGAIAGFDILGTNNSAIAALNIGNATSSDLYTINLVTGTASKVATIAGGERVRELTMTAVPTATVFGVTADGKLVSFKVGSPGTFDTSNTISGLQGGETVIGIDFRPANGKLYAATSGGRVYVVDPATGAASSPVMLTADATDTTAPFTGLMGTRFGVDFNPAADRLRIVSDAGQDLRINVDTGVTTTDGNLNPGAPAVFAAGYTSSYSPTPAATKLFDLDLATMSLQQQNPPNDGTLVPIGPLDPTAALMFTNIGEFDIAGGDDGLSLAALQPVGAAQSSLYRVSLKTGAVTALGTLGAAGSPLVSSLAIQLK